MQFSLTIWDTQGFVQQGIVDSPADLKIDRELNGNYVMQFKTYSQLSFYPLLTFRKIIRLHDLTKKSISSTVIGVPATSKNISLLDGDGLELGDYLIIYDNPSSTSATYADHSIKGAKSHISGAYTDEITENNDDARDDMNILGAISGDAYYWGSSIQFNVLTLNITTIGIGDYDVTFDYWNSSEWTELDYDVNTIGDFKEAGEKYIAFDIPSDWSQLAVDGDTFYWIRARISRSVSFEQQALATRAFLGFYGENCQIVVNDSTGLSVGDYIRVTSSNGDESTKIENLSADIITCDLGYAHLKDAVITTPGACVIAKIKSLREADTTASASFTSGASKVVTIADTQGFLAGDYVRVWGTNAENCLISSVSSANSTITLATVASNHAISTRITNYSYSLSRLDITPAVDSKVDYVNFTTFRLSEITEEREQVTITCNHLGYDLNNEIFTKDGRYEVSFNPDKTGSFIEDKTDINSLMDYILDRNIDSSDDPRLINSFIRGDLLSHRYSHGFVDVSNASATITGVNTLWWDQNIAAGSSMSIEGDSTIYTISHVTAQTTIELTATIDRETGTSLRYLIISKSIFDGDIYQTGTLAVVKNGDEITLVTGTWAAVEAGAQLRVINDDNIYYTLQAKSTAIMKLNKPIERSASSGLSYWMDRDRREISFSANTLRKALISLCSTFSDDDWVVWFEVNEDKSIDIIHRPTPFNGVDPTSALVVRPNKNLKAVRKIYDDIEYGNRILPLGATSNWENAFSGITGTVASDTRNTKTRIKLTSGDATKFRALDQVEILRYSNTITVSTAADKSITIAPNQKDFLDDGGAFTDYSTEAAEESTLNDVFLLPTIPATSDAFYFGANYQFNRLAIKLDTAGVGTWTIVWEYSQAGANWATLSFSVQEITDFTETEKTFIQNIFEIPSDWVIKDGANHVNNVTTNYWVRARVSAYSSVTTQPKASACWHGNLRVDEYRSGRLVVTSGNGSGQIRTIAFNDATTLTMTRRWDDIPYASTCIIAAQYSNPIQVEGFGHVVSTVSSGGSLRRVECKYFNTLTTGIVTATNTTTNMTDNTRGVTTTSFVALGITNDNYYVYNLSDYNNLTLLSAYGIITSLTASQLTFSAGLDEGNNDDFQVDDRYAVVKIANSVRGAYRGGIISFTRGASEGAAYELWGNDDVSFITDEQMDIPLPTSHDGFKVTAPSQLIEQLNETGLYPDYNPGPWVQFGNSSRYFQIDSFNGGRLYILEGTRSGDTYDISDTTANTIVPTGAWGTQPDDGDACMIVKETDLMLSLAKHDFTPLAGDTILLLLYETGGPLTVGKYASYRTTVQSYDEAVDASNNATHKLSKAIISVNDSSIFEKDQLIFVGTISITSDLLFSLNRGNQIQGQVRTVKAISNQNVEIYEQFDPVPQPGDHVEILTIANLDSIRKDGIIELKYDAKDLTDPRWLYFHAKKFTDKVSSKPIPTYQIDFLDLYAIDDVEWKFDQYQLGDTIRLIDEDLDIDISTLRINKESINLAFPSEIKVDVSNPSITLTKMMPYEIVDEIGSRLDVLEKENRFNKHKETVEKCIYFVAGQCRKTFPPNTFCNTLESNRDGRLTAVGAAIMRIHCGAYAPTSGHNPDKNTATTERFYAGGPDSFDIPLDPGEDDGEWHDLTTYDNVDGIDFIVTDVHLNIDAYHRSVPTYLIPETASFIEARVKGTGETVLETGGVNNGHDLIQGDTNGEGFMVEYRMASGVEATITITWWCWGYNQ